jgi:hypothetical protein
MSRKIGEDFVNDMIDRGRREWGALLYNDSNIAQPMYPLRGHYGMSKEAEPPGREEVETDFDRLHPVGISHDDHERDERDRGMERE